MRLAGARVAREERRRSGWRWWWGARRTSTLTSKSGGCGRGSGEQSSAVWPWVHVLSSGRSGNSHKNLFCFTWSVMPSLEDCVYFQRRRVRVCSSFLVAACSLWPVAINENSINEHTYNIPIASWVLLVSFLVLMCKLTLILYSKFSRTTEVISSISEESSFFRNPGREVQKDLFANTR